jgi:hypothetical protein
MEMCQAFVLRVLAQYSLIAYLPAIRDTLWFGACILTLTGIVRWVMLFGVSWVLVQQVNQAATGNLITGL